MDKTTSDFLEAAQSPRAWRSRRRGDTSAEAIARKVRAACVAGGMSAMAVLLAAVWRAAIIGPTVGGAFAVMCALVMLGLVYGTARYSRACATSLLWLYVCALASLAIGSLSAWSVVIGLVGMACVFVLVQGVQATYTRHEIEHEWSAWQVSLEHTLDPGVMAD